MAEGITKYVGKRGVTYQARIDLDPDPVTGARRQVMETFGTMAAASQWRKKVREEGTRMRDDARIATAAITMFDQALAAMESQKTFAVAKRAQVVKKAKNTVLSTAVLALGWKVGNEGENRVVCILHDLGVMPQDVQQQFPLGGCRLDFAWVRERIALEADGWVHKQDTTRAQDGTRDARLAAWGWTVLRVDVDADDCTLRAALMRVVAFVKSAGSGG